MSDFNFLLSSTRLRELRMKSGDSYSSLSKVVGCSEQVLKNYETAARNGGQITRQPSDKTESISGMRIETLFKLASYFNVSADYLLGLSPHKTTDKDLNAVCQYTGLTESAIKNIRQNSSDLTSRFLESSEFGEMIKIFATAKRNKNLLHPTSGHVALSVIAGADITVLNDNGAVLNPYFDKIPASFKQALSAIVDSGLAPMYKQELEEKICSLFNKIVEECSNHG